VIFDAKNFLGRENSPLPRSLPHWGGGHPFLYPTHLGAFGASILPLPF